MRLLGMVAASTLLVVANAAEAPPAAAHAGGSGNLSTKPRAEMTWYDDVSCSSKKSTTVQIVADQVCEVISGSTMQRLSEQAEA